MRDVDEWLPSWLSMVGRNERLWASHCWPGSLACRCCCSTATDNDMAMMMKTIMTETMIMVIHTHTWTHISVISLRSGG